MGKKLTTSANRTKLCVQCRGLARTVHHNILSCAYYIGSENIRKSKAVTAVASHKRSLIRNRCEVSSRRVIFFFYPSTPQR